MIRERMAISRSQRALAMAAEALEEVMDSQVDRDVAEGMQPGRCAELMGNMAEMVRPYLDHPDGI